MAQSLWVVLIWLPKCDPSGILGLASHCNSGNVFLERCCDRCDSGYTCPLILRSTMNGRGKINVWEDSSAFTVCVCLCVCVCVCVCVCACMCMCVCVCLCVCACMCVYMWVRMCVCVCECMYVCEYVCVFRWRNSSSVRSHFTWSKGVSLWCQSIFGLDNSCMCVCVCVFVCVCVHLWVR